MFLGNEKGTLSVIVTKEDKFLLIEGKVPQELIHRNRLSRQS